MNSSSTMIKKAAEFASAMIEPNAAQWEYARCFPRDVFIAAADASLAGLIVPATDGGSDLGPRGMADIMRKLAAADFAFAFSLVVHNNLAGTIARYGSVEQKQRWLPGMLSAKKIGAFLLTETSGGSDAAAIRCHARPQGSGWVLNGEKAWISNASDADVLSVYATIAPEQGFRGIACFLIPADRPGVHRLEPFNLMGGHALGTGGFSFTDVSLQPEDLLIAPGEAFKAAMAGIDLARVNVASMCCGMLERGIEEAVGFAGSRQAFGGPISDQQGIRWMLSDAATDLAAAHALTEKAIDALEAGQRATIAAAHAAATIAAATIAAPQPMPRSSQQRLR